MARVVAQAGLTFLLVHAWTRKVKGSRIRDSSSDSEEGGEVSLGSRFWRDAIENVQDGERKRKKEREIDTSPKKKCCSLQKKGRKERKKNRCEKETLLLRRGKNKED